MVFGMEQNLGNCLITNCNYTISFFFFFYLLKIKNYGVEYILERVKFPWFANKEKETQNDYVLPLVIQQVCRIPTEARLHFLISSSALFK